MATEVKIARNDTKKIKYLDTGGLRTIIVKTKYQGYMLEMEDFNFHYDSAVLLPDYGTNAPKPGTPDQNRVTGLAVLIACYKHAKDNPKQSIIIIGHTDRSGPSNYNLELSFLRANNVLFALLGKSKEWVDICLEKHKIEDIQQFLKWISYSRNWDCDPGAKTNAINEQTKKAIKNFQNTYKEKFKKDILVDGIVGEQTWGAFFDVYIDELKSMLGIDDQGIIELRSKLHFFEDGPQAFGCGENAPITSDKKKNYKNPIDRRVEILFFDPEEKPSFKCHQKNGVCNYKKCEFYNTDLYEIEPVPLVPLEPIPVDTVPIYLKLMYEGPEGIQHDMPKNFPVNIKYADGEIIKKTLNEKSIINFDAPVSKLNFTLEFEFAENYYIASMSPDSKKTGDKENLILEKDAVSYPKPDYNIFSLPEKWSLANTYWEVKGTSNYSITDANFKLQQGVKIGSEVSPVNMILIPRWQYIKFIYFDRYHKKTLSPLPLIINGGIKSDNLISDILNNVFLIRSNWFIDLPHPCQCIPWIIQDPPQPDKNIVLWFRTIGNTFIKSFGAGDRKLVRVLETSSSTSITSSSSTMDLSKNIGEDEIFDINIPSVDRLKYYDLPALWLSRNYHAHLLKGPNTNEAAKRDKFENLVIEATSPQQPIMFSLDDIILVDKNKSFLQSNPSNDKLAIFSHKLSNKTSYDFDLYNKDEKEPYITRKLIHETDRKYIYIAEYSDWTRLIIANGNVFDVFNERTTHSNDVVGARAAVRWYDDILTDPFLNSIKKEFITIEFNYSQQHNRSEIGNTDLCVIRCCDFDGEFEVAVIFQYFRFHFKFEKLRGDDARNWVNKAIRVIEGRWLEKNVLLLPDDLGKYKTAFFVRWFVQSVEKNICHTEIEVVDKGPEFRSYMDDTNAKWREKAIEDSEGSLVAAHECGHGASLDDEYLECWKSCSYFLPGFGDFKPGSPYVLDEQSMMKTNIKVRPRYFWHHCELLYQHFIPQKTRFNVVRHILGDESAYCIPYNETLPSSNYKSYFNFPLAQKKDYHNNGKGWFNLYFYPLGKDAYSQAVLKATQQFDSILVIKVQMLFSFQKVNCSFAYIHDFLKEIYRSIYNLNYLINGDTKDAFKIQGEIEDRFYSSCYIHLSPRFLVENFVDDEDYKKSLNINNKNDYDRKVQEIVGFYSEHYIISVIDEFTWFKKPKCEWTKDGRSLIYEYDEENKFWEFFVEMLGLKHSELPNQKNFEGIAKFLNNGKCIPQI